ncbi:endonuclease/exonuclease/phosphatase family protein [Cellulophaga sp. E6(2014)]|uniref:endonuclease/exonuclease/phosphatase family protein n=1 Tax=Cellulophaga sp. E6(2014) TaxID=1495334 RepID=UPI00051D09D7|nr:endonuclease/exonuclease/phosphatase family protein [Cellulophaga sp. E6(2014)]KGK29944.1 endonuclease [Cellulophaga sp. E6(2014)]
MKIKVFLRVFGVISILLTIFPYISANQWYIRIFDFPHLQLTLLTLLALLVYFLKFNFGNFIDYLFVLVLGLCFVFQSLKIYPYTAFAHYEVQNSSPSASNELSIYTANVLQENKKIKELLSDIKSNDADLMVFTETNTRWINILKKELAETYRYTVEVPLENTYGMVLFSKLEAHNAAVHYMVEDSIPSIHTQIILETKDTIQLYAIHPAPPAPQHNPSSVDRDAEMMKVTRLARESKFPVVVLGDFNDVAWSETTTLFQKVSGLLDLRKGRGFYSTYNAKSWFMRWPLDHVFASAHFRIKEVHRGSKIGSDHFPFYAKFTFEPALAAMQKLPEPTDEDLKIAFDQIIEEEKENE